MNRRRHWAVIFFGGVLAGIVAGFLLGSIAENRTMHRTIANIPDVDTIIECMVSEVPDNGSMIRSTLQFAAASGTLSATYDPSLPEIVRISGQGFSSTEVPYDFWMEIQYCPSSGKWVLFNWRWDQVKA